MLLQLIVDEAMLLLSVANFIIGLVYPVWQTLQTLEEDLPVDDAQWLTYWLCYAMLLIVEYAIDWILVLLPAYQFVRLVLLLWLTVPYLHGAEFMYENLLGPLYVALRELLGQAPALEMMVATLEDLAADGDIDGNAAVGGGGGGGGDVTSPTNTKKADEFNNQLLRLLK